MVSAVGDMDPIARSHSVVLMARIVDRQGRCVRRADVRAIEYSVRQIDVDESQSRNDAAEHVGASVAVDEVFFNDLQLNGWAVDGFGYNFRHAFALTSPGCGMRRGRRRYEVRYEFVTRFGEALTICFEVRG